jgi:uncharacterized membrane protein YfcA
MELIGYISAIAIGLLLGMLGGGGSILTVPVLVYLMGINPLLATTSSLFIVGTTSFAGSLRAYSKGRVNFRAVTEFGIPSIFSIFITRHYLLPSIPAHLFNIGELAVSRDMFLMLVFALLMLLTSVSMIRSKDASDTAAGRMMANQKSKTLVLVLSGLIIGVVTGLLGTGGGFLIIPSLITILRLQMKMAIGTSLLLIALNSLFGFLFSLNQFEYNWPLLLSFTALAIAGVFIGGRIAEKIPGSALKKGFGWFVLVMGLCILIKELVVK